MNKNILIITLFTIVAFGAAMYFLNNLATPISSTPTPTSTSTSITYTNTDYGFTFTLPASWQGYQIVKNSWTGTMIAHAGINVNVGINSPAPIAPTGPKLLIRNPKWTTAVPYEDMPILVFTTAQWNSYVAEDFSVSAAPIMASELGRNNAYVFALPPRWDYDYSLGYKEAEDIIAVKPLHPFNIGTSQVQGKLNINVICEQALAYMSFPDGKSGCFRR